MRASRTVAVAALLALAAGIAWLATSGSAPTRGIPQEPGDVTRETAPQTGATRDAPAPAELARSAADVVPVDAATDTRDVPAPDELVGRVVTAADGTPVPGADVRLLYCDADAFWNLDPEYGREIEELATTVSDAEGRFRFAVAPGRPHRLHVRHAGFAPATIVGCAGGSEVVVELGHGATVAGTVRCEGEPLRGAPVVIVVRGEGVRLAEGRTADDGGFRFTGVPPEKVYVRVQPADRPEHWHPLDLVEGGDHRAEIEIDAGEVLRGRVVDAETGVGIAGAEVSDARSSRRVARTDATGAFELAGADGSFADLRVRARGYASAHRVLAGRLDEPVEFALERGGEVEGRIVTRSAGLPGHLYVAVAASYVPAPGLGSTDWVRAAVEPDGRFLARGLRPDQHYWLYARADGHGTRVLALPRRLASGERHDVGDVLLEPAGGLSGRVVDEHGAALPGARVVVGGSSSDALAALGGGPVPMRVDQFERRDVPTDRAGRFTCTGLAAGTYRVTARLPWHPRRFDREVTVAAGVVQEGIEIVVETGEGIAGRLRLPDGREPGDLAAGIMLQAWQSGLGGGFAPVERDGTFRFRGLKPGRYTLTTTRTPPGTALSPRRDVPAGTEDVELRLEPAAVLTGRVVDAAGVGTPARVWVTWAERVASGSPTFDTDGDGAFRIDVARDFRGSVGASALADEWQKGSVEDVTAGRTDLVVRLAPAASSGR